MLDLLSRPFFSKKITLFSLVSLWLFHLINNYIWLHLDRYPLLWDSGSYYLESLLLSDLSKHFSISSFLSAIHVGSQYPPFVPLLTSLFYLIFDKTQDSAVLISNGIFLGVLIFSTYGITRSIFNKKAGLLAAFLVTMYPIVFGHSRTFMYDLPATAVTCLSIYIFQKADSFRNTGYSLLFGIALGIGLLIKFSVILFIASAISYYFYRDCSKAARDISKGRFLSSIKSHLKQAVNFNIAVLIAVVLVSLWCLPNFPRFLYAVLVYPESCRQVCPLTFGLASISYYFFALINYQISFFLFLVFVGSLIYFIKLKLENRLFLALWVLLSYIGCIFVNYKSPRYTMPYLPAIAIISSIGLMSIRHDKVRRAVIAVVAVIAAAQFFAYSYGIKFFPALLKIDMPVKLAAPLGVRSVILFDRKGGDNPLEQHVIFREEDWRSEEILDLLMRFGKHIENKPINVFIIPDDPRIHSPLTYLAYLRKAPISITVASVEEISNSAREYVIIKDSKWMCPSYFRDIIARSERQFEKIINQFTLISKIKLPDESNLLIYKRR